MRSVSVIRVNPDLIPLVGISPFEKKDKIFQEYRRRWEEQPKSFYAGDFPLHLDIEVTNKCNLACPFCAQVHSRYKKMGFMDLNLCKRIIDEGSQNGAYACKFSLRGEPLLHKQIDQMVKYAKEKGFIDVYLNTNATLLNEDMIFRLIDAGLDRISISFEGYNKRSYERSRIGAKFERVVMNVKRMVEIRNMLGVKYPQIRIQAVLLPELQDKIKEYVNLWSQHLDLGLDEISYLTLRDEGKDHTGVKAMWACPSLWQRLTITYDGTILPCPQMTKDASYYKWYGFGNVAKMSLKEVWLGETEERFRRLHREGYSHEIDHCNKCSYRASEITKLEINRGK
jgi:radical SAM protein with 4Fe4S-binding SPASM domain